MNRAFIFLTTLSVLMLLSIQAPAKNQKLSEDMILVLTHHKSGPNDLDPKALTLDKARAFPSEAERTEYEVYHIPYPKGVADYFAYRVYLHIKSGRYWIYQGGGIGGVSRFYGPGLVNDLRK